MLNFLTRIFGSRNDRLLKGHARLVRGAAGLEESLKGLSDEALRGKTGEFRERLAKGEPLSALQDYMAETDRFEVDEVLNGKLVLSSSPGGYVRARSG